MQHSLTETERFDAFGRHLLDYHNGFEGTIVLERDDGFVGVGENASFYFSTHDDWPEYDQVMIQFVNGRVLDIGCGAGRHALYLQEQGHEVVGIDTSPGAVEVCRLRGLRQAYVRSIHNLADEWGQFDTLLLMGFGFILFGNPMKAKQLLKQFHSFTQPTSIIIATMADPYTISFEGMPPEIEENLRQYADANRENGKLPGVMRLRLRYMACATEWSDWMYLSKNEMEDVLKDTGWEIQSVTDFEGPMYGAVIAKSQIP